MNHSNAQHTGESSGTIEIGSHTGTPYLYGTSKIGADLPIRISGSSHTVAITIPMILAIAIGIATLLFMKSKREKKRP